MRHFNIIDLKQLYPINSLYCSYCFTRTSTECDEETKKIEREVCTYTYATKKESLKATTVKVGSHIVGCVNATIPAT